MSTNNYPSTTSSVISDEAVLACFDHLAQEYLAKLAADCPLSLERQLLHKYLLHGGLNLPPLTFYDATTKTLRNRRQRQRRKERQRQKKAQAAAQADNVEQPTPPLPTHSARSSVPSMPEDMAEELAALSLQAPPDRIGASSPEPTDPTDTDSTAYLSVPSARPAAFFEAHTVNFTLFARYYFSHHLLVLEPMFDMDKLTAFPVAVGNFLEHAQRINACPEYHEDIDQAIAVVRQAQRHLVSLRRAFYLMPGKPNMARSARFDGEFKYILEPVPWAIAELEPECTLSPTDYQTLIAAIPADATIVQSRQQLRVVATVDSTTGLATLYPWTVDPADWTLDTPVTPPSDSSDQYTIDMGPTLCQYLSPGFIIEACYHTLSDGTHYCDSVTAVWPPYYAVVNEFAQRLAK